MLSCFMLQWLKYFLAKFWDRFSSYASTKLSGLKQFRAVWSSWNWLMNFVVVVSGFLLKSACKIEVVCSLARFSAKTKEVISFIVRCRPGITHFVRCSVLHKRNIQKKKPSGSFCIVLVSNSSLQPLVSCWYFLSGGKLFLKAQLPPWPFIDLTF